MSKNRVRFYLILAILLILVSVIAFAIPMEKTPVFWLSYAFVVIAIVIQTYSWPNAFAGDGARSKFYGFPIARVTTIYLVIQFILSLVFMTVGTRVPVWIPVILYVLFLALAAIGFITADTVRDEVERQETVRKANTEAMKALQAKVYGIAATCSDSEMKKTYDHMAEAFRYSDPVSSEATQKLEMKLDMLLDEIQESGNADLIKKIETVLSERNQLCKMSK